MTEAYIPGGYILLSRRLIESGIMQKPPIYFKIWTWLLLKAQHKDYGNLKRGQLITSIAEIQEAMSYKVGFRIEKPSKKQVWGVLEWLRNPEMENSSEILVNNIVNVTTKEPMIVTMKVTHGILVTIVKYNVYQDPKNYEGNDEGTMKVTMKERRRQRQGNNINKNVKNEQECNKNDKDILSSQQVDDDDEEKPKFKFDADSVEIQLAQFMISEMLKVKPDSKVPKDDVGKLQGWATDIDRMMRLDKRTPKQIAELFRWAQNDSFWCSNIRSPQKLRKQWDTLELQRNRKKAPPQQQKRIPRAFASLIELEEGGIDNDTQ